MATSADRRSGTGTSRIAALDGLRLLAALAVAVYHYTVAWRIDGVALPEQSFPRLSHASIYGFLGVELFFLISGFVICMSSWGRKPGDFFVSRVSRLYPAYWACVLISAAVISLLPVTGGVPASDALTMQQTLLNLTMLQQPLGVPAVDTVYWTLLVELRFYLIFAVVVWFGLTYRRAVLFCLLWMTAVVFAPTLGSPVVNAIVITEYGPYFVAGVAMYLIHRFGATTLLLAIIGFCWLVSLHRVDNRLADVHPGFHVPSWPGQLAITGCYLVLLGIALGYGQRINWRWLVVAGAVSYPFYLLHQRIGYGLIRTGHDRFGLPALTLVIAAVIVVVVAAWLVHRLVERPLTSRLRSGMERSLLAVRADGLRQRAVTAESGAASHGGVDRTAARNVHRISAGRHATSDRGQHPLPGAIPQVADAEPLGHRPPGGCG